MGESKLEKTIEGIETIREFFGFGLPSQNKVFEAYQTILTDTLKLLKEQAEEIEHLKRTHIVSTGSGMAIGAVHGGMTIKKEYHQQAKEVYNIGHIDRLDL